MDVTAQVRMAATVVTVLMQPQTLMKSDSLAVVLAETAAEAAEAAPRDIPTSLHQPGGNTILTRKTRARAEQAAPERQALTAVSSSTTKEGHHGNLRRLLG